jgi:NAD(P)H-dependent FMN reductase
MSTTRLLAISGSLRARSSNSELLRAAAAVGAPATEVELYAGLGELPHFNPDLDREGSVAPPPVHALRAAIGRADGLLISSPEYAHGVPGSLKNALDWLVSSPVMLYKPVGLLNASPHATIAHAALAETLRTMSAELVEAACAVVPLAGRGLDAAGIAHDPELRAQLRRVLEALAAAVPAYHARSATA